MTRVTLYSRPGCHLCDQARTMLERAGAEALLELHEVDIHSDDALLRRYLERIPVIAIDGEEAFELDVDESALRERLLGAR